MEWSRSVDLYCERTDPSFWAEPLNAITNAAFLIAALAAFGQWNRRRDPDLPVLALIAVTALVGLGSFAFHTMATRGAALLDTIPIAIFTYGYLLLALRRFLRLGWIATGAILLGFAVVSHGLAWVVPRGFLNGSYAYLPALTALLWVASRVQEERPRGTLLLAVGMFTLSLIFRTIDIAICGVFPLGTHFLWHGLNGVVVYLLLDAAMKYRRRAGQMPPYSQAMPS
ncbi:MAG: ceramidase domain-containing protein [Panacagrimonas sp.]